MTIYGHWYASTCNDTGAPEPLEPLPLVHLTLTLPGGDMEQLGEFNPGGQDVGFAVAIHVPAATEPGIATVNDDQPEPASFKFRVGN